MLGKCPTPCDYAARRNPDGAKLSFAFVFRRLKYLSILVHPHQNYVRKYWLNPKTSMIINVKNNNNTAQRIILPLALVDASRIPISSFPNNLTPTSNSLVVCFMSIILFFSSILSPCNFGGGDGYCPHVQNILQHLQFLFIPELISEKSKD